MDEAEQDENSSRWCKQTSHVFLSREISGADCKLSCHTYLDIKLLDLLVHPLLDRFPHLVCPGTEDVAAGDIVVVDHLRQRDHLLASHGMVSKTQTAIKNCRPIVYTSSLIRNRSHGKPGQTKTSGKQNLVDEQLWVKPIGIVYQGTVKIISCRSRRNHYQRIPYDAPIITVTITTNLLHVMLYSASSTPKTTRTSSSDGRNHTVRLSSPSQSQHTPSRCINNKTHPSPPKTHPSLPRYTPTAPGG